MRNLEPITGIVIESYRHGENQVVVACCSADVRILHFFYLPAHPSISFGDTFIMNFCTDRYWVHYGNPRLTYRIFPLTFPGSLLWELITDRIDPETPNG